MNDQVKEQTEQEPSSTEADGWEWMLVEIMGHRTHWGRARQEERFGAQMLRIDVPVKGDPANHGWTTHYYGGTAIFSFSLTDEATAMARNKPWDAPSRLILPKPQEVECDPGDSFDFDGYAAPDEDAA